LCLSNEFLHVNSCEYQSMRRPEWVNERMRRQNKKENLKIKSSKSFIQVQSEGYKRKTSFNYLTEKQGIYMSTLSREYQSMRRQKWVNERTRRPNKKENFNIKVRTGSIKFNPKAKTKNLSFNYPPVQTITLVNN